MNKRTRGSLAWVLAVFAGSGQAADFSLQDTYWGNITAPDGWLSNGGFGVLPGTGDDAKAKTVCDAPFVPPCGSVYLADVETKNPITASVRSFDGSGRRLYIDTGGKLTTGFAASQASGLTMKGGQLTTFSEFTVGKMTISGNGSAGAAVITMPNAAKFVILGDSDVQGTLDFRSGQGEVQNLGKLTQSGIGNMSLFFGQDFRNRTGGTVDIQNDNDIAIRSPDGSQGTPPIRFVNDAGATLIKSGGSGTSVIEAPIFNAGKVAASSGQLTLAGGGTHSNGASLEATGSGVLGLQGAHTVTGAVTASGDGHILLGEFGKPGTMTIANGGTLTNSSTRFFQNGSLTVESGGRLTNTLDGQFLSVNMNVAAGGHFENSGSVGLAGTLVNAGDVAINAGSRVYEGGTGSYTQTAGSTKIAGSFQLDDGSYQQEGGHTTIDAGGDLILGVFEYDENTDTGRYVGGTYLQTAGKTTVNGLIDSDVVRFEDGELNGSGTIRGDVVIDSQVIDSGTVTIDPGNSPGLLTIDGNFMASGAIPTTFNIEIGGYDPGIDFDQFHVTGNAEFNNFLVNFIFGSFVPNVGDSFDWLVVDGVSTFNSPLECNVTSSLGTILGECNEEGSFRVTEVDVDGGGPGEPVPAPGTLALLALGLAGFGLRRRRKH